MRTETVKIYTFDELSEESKQRAIEQYRGGNIEYAWADEAFESLKKFCEEFNIKFKNATFSQFSDVNYSIGHIDDVVLGLSGTRLRSYLLNNYYLILFERKGLGGYKERENGKFGYKKRSNIVWVKTDCPFTGYCTDESLLKPIREYLDGKPNKKIDLEDILGDCIAEWIKDSNADCEYQDSDEYIREHFIANEYEFTEDGKRY